jgi:diguanylate cyclase (GGDEF)-like protein
MATYTTGKFEYAINAVHHPVFCMDSKNTITLCNQSFCNLLDLSEVNVIGRRPTDFFLDFKEFFVCDQDIITGFEPFTQQNLYEKLSMTLTIWSHCIVSDTRVIGAVCTVTSHALSQNYLTAQNPLFRYTELMLQINQSMLEVTCEQDLLDLIMKELYLVFGHHDCGCILINRDNHLKMVSQVGYTPEAMANFDIETERSYFWRYANGNINKVYRINQIDLIEQEDYTKVATSQSGLDMLSSISAPILIDGKLYGLINFDSPKQNAFTEEQVAIMEYVRTQLSIAIKNMKLYERTVTLSRYDHLTGLMNRHYFEEKVLELLEQVKRKSESLVLIVCDVDYLKQVNDSMGHLKGDELLWACGNAIKKACGENAFVARFGGDEFVAVVNNTTEHALSEKLEEERRLLMLTKCGHYSFSFSFGLSSLQYSDETYYAILKRADDAMYLEKEFRMKGRRKTDW